MASKKLAICKGVIGDIEQRPDVPDGMVLGLDGMLMTVDQLPSHISVPDSPVGKVMLPDGSVKNVTDFPIPTTLHINRQDGACELIGKGEAMVFAGSEALVFMLIGIVFTYIYTRVRKTNAPLENVRLRASYLYSGLFFAIATISLILGLKGDVEMSILGVTINTALPSLVLFLFSWLVWRSATKKDLPPQDGAE